MSLHITDNEVQKQIKKLGYKGCRNCQHQIAPLRRCKWAEEGGDGKYIGFVLCGIRRRGKTNENDNINTR